MALLFSAVTMKSGEAETRFLVGGIPRIKNDLNGWTAYEEFMQKIDGASEVNIQGKIYLYGDGEFVNATVEEVAYMYERIKRREDFLRTRCQYWNDTEFKLIPIISMGCRRMRRRLKKLPNVNRFSPGAVQRSS